MAFSGKHLGQNADFTGLVSFVVCFNLGFTSDLPKSLYLQARTVMSNIGNKNSRIALELDAILKIAAYN